jgi:phage terminase large subunit-like protein
MPTPAELKQYAGDPMAFFRALIIPAARGKAPFAEVMADFQRERFEALAPSLLALAHGKEPPIGRFWLEGTKGCSKDGDLAAVVIWLVAFSGSPLRIQVAAADEDQAKELKTAAQKLLRLNTWLNKRVEVQTSLIVCKGPKGELTSNAEIIAADVAGSHGATPDLLILNELSHVAKWEFVENLMDNASKVPRGVVIVATNAGYVNTPAYKWREIAQQSDRWFFHQFAKPAPWISAAEMEEARKRNSQERYLRLWFGIWASGTGDAIDAEDVKACTTQAGPLTNAGNELCRWMCVAGLDLGVKHDHSALVVLAVRYGVPRVRLAWCTAWKPPKGGQVNLQAVEDTCRMVARKFELRKLLFDPSQALHMAQRLKRKGIHTEEVTFTPANLDQMATSLMSAFRTRVLDLYPCALQEDVMRLTIEEKAYGQRLSAVSDSSGHADLATAFAIALPAALRLFNSTMGMPTEKPHGLRVESNPMRHGVTFTRGIRR